MLNLSDFGMTSGVTVRIVISSRLGYFNNFRNDSVNMSML